MHTDFIFKIISYENDSKNITCSKDKPIIVRNSIYNSVIKTLIGHKGQVNNIILLSNGRLASSSDDKTIKIWNLTDGNCEQTLIGHSSSVNCLLELPDSLLLSGSFDSSIGLWDISQKDKKELKFSQQVKYDKQSHVYCMTLINANELAISSKIDINIYSFNTYMNMNMNRSLTIFKILKGHTDIVMDMKLMNKSKDSLLSCSRDKDVRLWNISQGYCLKIFKGHSNSIRSIQILSEKIFISAGAEIIFWNFENTEIIKLIQPCQYGENITSLIRNDKNELIFVGGHNFIGFINI